MSDLGFVNELFDNTNAIYSLAAEQIEFYKELMGTRVVVSRLKGSSKTKDVFGSTATSTLAGDKNREEFEYVVVINLKDMRNVYLRTPGQIEFYDNKNVIKLGDVLTFGRGKFEFKFKVVLCEAFSESAEVIYRYQIMGIVETKSLG